ncbi:hypothetical protein WG78_17230 [Amantichitinum ursilacus]|uniref:Uncharacterized protein n=1 Tax=Amantichitinum ursilacus TaxID=857265 RepID=A0A0N0GM49_9NEIS|nr:hypothetical protein WG78_17230 [Amantichitinum ursilacus]
MIGGGPVEVDHAKVAADAVSGLQHHDAVVRQLAGLGGRTGRKAADVQDGRCTQRGAIGRHQGQRVIGAHGQCALQIKRVAQRQLPRATQYRVAPGRHIQTGPTENAALAKHQRAVIDVDCAGAGRASERGGAAAILVKRASAGERAFQHKGVTAIDCQRAAVADIAGHRARSAARPQLQCALQDVGLAGERVVAGQNQGATAGFDQPARPRNHAIKRAIYADVVGERAQAQRHAAPARQVIDELRLVGQIQRRPRGNLHPAAAGDRVERVERHGARCHSGRAGIVLRIEQHQRTGPGLDQVAAAIDHGLQTQRDAAVEVDGAVINDAGMQGAA